MATHYLGVVLVPDVGGQDQYERHKRRYSTSVHGTSQTATYSPLTMNTINRKNKTSALSSVACAKVLWVWYRSKRVPRR